MATDWRCPPDSLLTGSLKRWKLGFKRPITCAIVAEDRDDLARKEINAGMIDSLDPAKGDGDVAHLDKRCFCTVRHCYASLFRATTVDRIDPHCRD